MGTCYQCNGEGVIEKWQRGTCSACQGYGFYSNGDVCRKCDGTGIFERHWEEKCIKCDGTGEYPPHQSHCIIATACCEAKGLSDDCSELNTLRIFRDEYVRNLPEGSQLIREYYKIAPLIVARINSTGNPKEIYLSLYERLVSKSLQLIYSGKNDEAFKNYLKIINELKQNHLS